MELSSVGYVCTLVIMRTRLSWRWRSVTVVCGLVLLGGAAPARAQSQSADVGKILGQYAKAEGGGGKLSKVVTLRLDGTVTEINGKAPVNIIDVKAAGGGGAAANAAASGDGSSGSTGPGAGLGTGLGASAATYTFETKLPNR